MRGGLRSIASFLTQCFLDIIYPKHCLNCDLEGSYWCANCKQLPIKTWDNHLSLVGEKYFDEIYCLGDYEDKMLGELIKACKYKFVKELCSDLGELLAQELVARGLQGTIVPVPLSKRRMAWRGFNQAAEIAKIVSRTSKIEYFECLIKSGNYKAQAKLNEEARLKNLVNAFSVTGVVPKNVILIDDVITTGATINECAKVLKENGTRYITVVALAKG